MSLRTIQVYLQGELVSIDVIEEAEVQAMTQHFERMGYEVRSEPAWKPAHSIYENEEVERRQIPITTPNNRLILRPTNQEESI